ncbi:MAG: hypothetical protein ACI4JN_06560, partial [Ruminococcus sp.]
MQNNTLKRIISVFLAVIMISCISLSDVYNIYEAYAEDSVSTEVIEESVQPENTSEPAAPSSENETREFEYHSDDFSAKLKMESNAVFSIENESLNADDVLLSVTAIDESDERFEKLYQSAADNEHFLLLYDIGFYTESGIKADVSECNAQITIYFDKPYAVCRDGNLSVVKYIEIPNETDEGSEISYECSETEITGSTYENDELKDVTFHVDSFAVYGILIPESQTKENVQEAAENGIESVQENTYILAGEENGESNGEPSQADTIT